MWPNITNIKSIANFQDDKLPKEGFQCISLSIRNFD